MLCGFAFKKRVCRGKIVIKPQFYYITKSLLSQRER
nr:MAG TPA: hypothetical protein [Caudoviricetes sp.]